jgi:hypothetical protein
MTYNMEIAGEGDPVSDADVHKALGMIQAAKRRRLNAASDVGHKAATRAMTAGLIALYKAHPNRFELTAGSMVDARIIMADFGMLDVETQQGRFPNYRECGVTDQMIRDAAGEDGRETPELDRYHAARDTVLEAQAENPVGIPQYKLLDNSGWLVTPDEITSALGAYRTAVGDGAEQSARFWWPYWIAFLERAAHHGGFRVH